MLYPKAEKLSLVLFLMILFAIKMCCDYCWRLDDDLLQAMAAFDAEQVRQASLREVTRQQQMALWEAQKAQRASRAPARAHQFDETALSSTRAGAELPLAAAPSAPHHATTDARYTTTDAHHATTDAHHATTDTHHATTDARSSGAAGGSPQTNLLHLNQIDSLTLLSVKGIGPYSAGKILAYRRALGGFVSLDQLDEIEGLRAENLQALKQMAYPMAAGDSLAGVKQLLVNKADFKQLLRHPYLSYSQVCAIVNRRREIGRIDSLEALVFMEEFGPKDLHRLRPYLDFQ